MLQPRTPPGDDAKKDSAMSGVYIHVVRSNFNISDPPLSLSPPALVSALHRLYGVVVFLSTPLAVLDTALRPYFRQITFPAPTGDTLQELCYSYLCLSSHRFEGSREEVMAWAADADKIGLSSSELVAICYHTIDPTRGRSRAPGLGDLIQAYVDRTGRPNEWDLVTDQSLYGGDQTMLASMSPRVSEFVSDHFGAAGNIPSDGRLDILFSNAFLAGKPDQMALHILKMLGLANIILDDFGPMHIFDWGWPKGLWCPMRGCLYEMQTQHRPLRPTNHQTPTETPQQQWEKAGFTCGLRSLLDGEETSARGAGKPWRRLL